MDTVAARVETLSTREKIALAVSGAIVLATAIYWIVQISDVIATLKMAYGE
jgi:type II secretory pathway component PulM